MSKITSLKKPIHRDAVLAFAEGAQDATKATAKVTGQSKSENAPKGQKSGLLPTGDVRLTANIREELHLKLKIKAAQERTTIGELIEQWVEGWR
jgi:hypothetical protein